MRYPLDVWCCGSCCQGHLLFRMKHCIGGEWQFFSVGHHSTFHCGLGRQVGQITHYIPWALLGFLEMCLSYILNGLTAIWPLGEFANIERKDSLFHYIYTLTHSKQKKKNQKPNNICTCDLENSKIFWEEKLCVCVCLWVYLNLKWHKNFCFHFNMYAVDLG